MAKPKSALAQTASKLAAYKFDSSNYLSLKPLVHREASTGKFAKDKSTVSFPKAKSKR